MVALTAKTEMTGGWPVAATLVFMPASGDVITTLIDPDESLV